MVAKLDYHSLVLMSGVLLQVCQSVHRHACYHCQHWPWQRSQVLVEHARRGHAYGLATVRGQSPTAVVKGTVLLAEPFKACENYAMVIIQKNNQHSNATKNGGKWENSVGLVRVDWLDIFVLKELDAGVSCWIWGERGRRFRWERQLHKKHKGQQEHVWCTE